jgi:iron complex outermembrane recepter protein
MRAITAAWPRTALFITTSMAALALQTVAASAQTQPGQGQGGEELETIIITAQRQAESLQTVPIAVSAFSAEQLEKSGLTGVDNLQFALPNITFTKTNFTGASFQIRGIGNLAVGATVEESTSVHVNDIPIGGARIFETEFFDVERVEVLRGPQGTQFGRNATGGVFNLITKRPTNEFTSEIELEYGNFNALKLKGALNAPISDNLAVRIAALYVNRDGYTKNLFTGNRIDGRDSISVRGSVRWNIGDSTTLDLMGSHFRENSNRSRIQKQLCQRDVTGIYGCLPNELRFETTNANSTFPVLLTSPQFLQIALAPAGASALAPALAASNIAGPDAFFGVVNPADYRTVRIDTEPTYRSGETIAQLSLKHDFEQFSVRLNAGYTENDVDSTTDYYLAVANPFTVPLAIQNPALAGPLAPVMTNIRARLFQGNNVGVSSFVGGPNNLTGFIGGNVANYSATGTEYDRSFSRNKQHSIEGIVSSQLDGRFNFLVGAIYGKFKAGPVDYYVGSSSLDYAAALLGGLQGGQALASPFFNSENNDFTLKTVAGFGEVYFNVTDELKLTAGLRYTNDKKSVRDRQTLLSIPIPYGTTALAPLLAAGSGGYDADLSRPGLNAYREARAEFNKLTGRFVIDWKPVLSFTDETLVYASYSRGSKPGGFNPPFDPALFPSATPSFGPETINAFEIGTKNRFAGGRAQLNLSAFYYDYKQLQLSRIIQRTSFNDNADAEIWGVEAELQVRPATGLLLSGSISYLDTKLKNKAVLDPSNPTAGRSDVLLIKDLQTGANCVAVPAAGGVAIGTQLSTVGSTLTAIGTNPALTPLVGAATQAQLAQAGGATSAAAAGSVAIPGMNHRGAFGLCAALRGAQAAVANPALAPLLASLPAGVRFSVTDGIETDITGSELPNSPKWKLSGAMDYTYGFENDWTLNGRVDISYQSNFYGRIFNLASDRLPGFTLVNARLTAASPDGRFSGSVWVQNLTDKTAVTGLYVTDQSTGLFRNVFTTEPRRFGVTLGAKF